MRWQDLLIGFGKHGSRRLGWVVEHDPAYLVWLVGTDLSTVHGYIRGAIKQAARAADDAMVTRKLGAFRQVKTYEQRQHAQRQAAYKACAMNVPKRGA